MEREYLVKRIGKLTGKIGFYYKNLVNDKIITYNSTGIFSAASLIKVPPFLWSNQKTYCRRPYQWKRYGGYN